MKSLYFYLTIFSFFGGVIVQEFSFFSGLGILCLLVVTTMALAFLFFHARVKNKSYAHPIILIAVCMISFSLGAFRMERAVDDFKNNSLDTLFSKHVTFIGEVEDSYLSGNGVVLSVYAYLLQDKVVSIAPEKILLNDRSSALDFRDIVVFSGKIMLPKNFDSKTGGEFDYVSYLRKEGVKYTVPFPTIIKKEHNGAFSVQELLFDFRDWFVSNIQNLIPEPAASLAAGVTVAGKGSLPKDVQDDFVKAGLIHIVVLSGYNIAIVVRALMYVFGFLGRKKSALIAGAGIVLFIVMTGGALPVVRSGIMAGVMLLGMLSYKNILPNRALFAAGFIMVFFNPFILLHDASFALSFLATFAIINIVDYVKPLLYFVTERFQMRNILSETLATQMFVLPYLLFQIGRLSIIAPLSNVLVLPLISPIMFLSFIVGFLASIPFLTLPFAGALYILISFVIWLAHFLGGLPFASFDIKQFPLWAMCLFYAVYFVSGSVLVKRERCADLTTGGVK